MRHVDDIMNAENWNTDLKKTSPHKNSDVNETDKPDKDSASKGEDVSVARLSKGLNSHENKHTAEAATGETEPSEKVKNTEITYEQPLVKKVPLPKSDDITFSQKKKSSYGPRGARTRKVKKSNKKWLFFLPGVLISIVSGVMVYTWLVHSDNSETFSSQESSYENEDVTSDNLFTSLLSKVKGSVVAEDGDAEKNQNIDNSFDNSHEALRAGMIDAKEELAANEDLEDNYAAGTGDNFSIDLFPNEADSDLDEGEELALGEDGASEKDDSFLDSDQELNANMMKTDNGPEEVREVEDYPAAGIADDTPVRKEISPASTAADTGEIQDTPVKAALEGDLALEETQLHTIYDENNGLADDVAPVKEEESAKLVERESAKIIEQPVDESSSGISYDDGETIKAKQLSRHLETDDKGGDKEEGGLDEGVQSSKIRSQKTTKTEELVPEKTTISSENRSPGVNSQKPEVTAGSSQGRFSEQYFAGGATRQSTDSEEMKHNKRDETQLASKKDSSIPAQEGSTASAHLIDKSNSAKDTDSEVHTSLNAVTKEPLPIGSAIKNEETDIAEGTGKKFVEATSVKEQERTNSRDKMEASLAPDNASPRHSNLQNLQAGLPSALKEMFVNYEDQFNTHSNNWPEYDNSMTSAFIEEGEYHIEHKATAGSDILLDPYGIPTDMDFMMQVAISSVRSTGENSYGLVFGALDGENNFSFQIRNDHFYLIEKRHGGHGVELTGGPINNIFIGQDSYKTMKIVKQGNMLRFYINDHYIDEIANNDFAGDKVGFLVKGSVKIAVDWTKKQIRFKN